VQLDFLPGGSLVWQASRRIGKEAEEAAGEEAEAGEEADY